MAQRRKLPDLVQPAADHIRFGLSQLGVPSTRDLRLADVERAKAAQGRRAPRPIVAGRVATGEALTNLLQVLAELGLIDDQTVQ